jgi:hypothetical protein
MTDEGTGNDRHRRSPRGLSYVRRSSDRAGIRRSHQPARAVEADSIAGSVGNLNH